MDEARRLCRHALARFGVRCLDNVTIDLDRLERGQIRIVANALMAKGGREAFLLGRRISDLLACP